MSLGGVSGPPIYFYPSSLGGADDISALVALLNANAYKRPVQLAEGQTYLSPAPPPQLVPGVVLYGGNGAGIICSYTDRVSAPSPYRTPLGVDPITVPIGGATTLASRPAIFATALSLTAKTIGPSGRALRAGDSFYLQDNVTTGAAQQGQVYDVVAVSGTGPFTVTIDRPILYSFPSGCQVTCIQSSNDIYLLGNGMTITGTDATRWFERAISIAAANRCVVQDWTINGLYSAEYCCAIDTGSRFSVRSRVRVYEAPTTGISTEGCEGITNYDCVVQNSAAVANTNAAFLFQAAYNCWNVNCHGLGRAGAGGAGVMFGFVNDGGGCRQSGIQGGSYIGNAYGIQITGSSSDIDIIGADISGNVIHGVWSLKQSATLTPARTRILGGSLRGNGTGTNGGCGAYFDGTVGNTMIGVRSENNGNGTLMGAAQTINGGEVSISRCDFTESASNLGSVKSNSASDVLSVAASKITCNYVGTGYGVVSLLGVAYLRDILFTFGTDGIPVYQGGGTVTWGGMAVSVGYSYGYYQAGGVSKALDGRGGFASCATPYTQTSGTANFGTFTLNGVTQVDVAGTFPLGAIVTWTLNTVGSTLGLGEPYFSQAPIANHFYVKSATAGANDVYNWQAWV